MRKSIPKKSYGGSILSNAGSMAATGFTIGGPIGAGIGAGIGGVLGLLQEKAKRNELAKQKQLETEAVRKEQLFINRQNDRQIMSNFPTYGVNQSYFAKGGEINKTQKPTEDQKKQVQEYIDKQNTDKSGEEQYNRTLDYLNDPFNAERLSKNISEVYEIIKKAGIPLAAAVTSNILPAKLLPYFKSYLLSEGISYADNNDLPAEASNVVYNKIIKPQNYTSEFAGGIVDFKQAYSDFKEGNILPSYKEGKTNQGAVLNSLFGLSGVIEIPDKYKQIPILGKIANVDNFVEKTKLVGDLLDVGTGVHSTLKKEKRFGGNTTPQYEAEDEEVVQFNQFDKPKVHDTGYLQQHSSTTATIKGKSHEQGGEDMSGGERIFSDKVYFHSKKDADIIQALRKTLKGF